MDEYTNHGGLHVVPSQQGAPAEQPRRLAKRIVAIRLPEPYEILSVTAWVNFPNTLLEQMRRQAREAQRRSRERQRALEDDPLADVPDEGEDQGGIAALLSQVIVSHDFVDFDGRPYPPADDLAFYREVPNDLLLVTMRAIMEQVGKLPTTRSRR